MAYITKKKFEEHYEEIKNLLKKLESVEPLLGKEYPNIKDFGSFRKGIREMATKMKIDKENEKIASRNKDLKRSVKSCKNNLTSLINSKKDSAFGLIHYNKVHTLNWGEVDMKGFSRYLQAGLDIFNLGYAVLDL